MVINDPSQYDGTTATYLINGIKYRFIRVHMENGILRGYCQSQFSWAWLTSDRVQFDDCLAVPATKILG